MGIVLEHSGLAEDLLETSGRKFWSAARKFPSKIGRLCQLPASFM